MYNLQDNQPNNLNNKLTNQSKGYQYHQTEYKQENKGMQWGIRFLHGKPPRTMKIKKPQGLRPINLNSLFEIKLHKFT